ncbi:MAG: sensor histidine kinase, partial [Spirosoma sp.]|nr:sensor histidine kinase [Spirosoma sp.]
SNMQKALATPADDNALTDFETNLKKQEANVTEQGERTATTALRREFSRLKARPQDSLTLGRIHQYLFALDDLNRQAIGRKSDRANQTAHDALVLLALVGTLCILIVFSFISTVPSYIANPLRELTQGIKQIASRNFEERLHFQSSDEFGELAQSFNAMAQKLDEYEHSNLAQVLFEKQRIDTLIQIMTDGIIGLDENRRILFANPVACRLLSMVESQLVGQYAPDIAASNDLMRSLIQDLMAADVAPSTGSKLLKIFDEGKEAYFTERVYSVDVMRPGEEVPQIAGYVVVLANITSYKELDLAKTNFIATVSHELKTPLSSIKLSLKLLEDQRVGELNTEQKQLVDTAGDAANRLLKLTGELLNLAQVESGQIQLKINAVAPTDLITCATQALYAQAKQKQLRFELAVESNLPAVKADPDKASWVLINFLSNAVRHSPPETTIAISARQINDCIDFIVQDNGPGLQAEHLARVFDRYFTVPDPDEHSGTGLGLAISKEFIEAMGGTIGIKQEESSGAAFWFRLPIY